MTLVNRLFHIPRLITVGIGCGYLDESLHLGTVVCKVKQLQWSCDIDTRRDIKRSLKVDRRSTVNHDVKVLTYLISKLLAQIEILVHQIQRDWDDLVLNQLLERFQSDFELESVKDLRVKYLLLESNVFRVS